jgi:hypothetical protein
LSADAAILDDEIRQQTTCPLEMLEPRARAVDLLKTATDIVGGDREKTHGSKKTNMQHTADLWSAYLGFKITAENVAWMMVMLKASRTKTGIGIDDHYIDGAGYAAIAGEVR